VERAGDLDEQHAVAPASKPQRDLLAGAELGGVPVGGGKKHECERLHCVGRFLPGLTRSYFVDHIGGVRINGLERQIGLVILDQNEVGVFVLLNRI